MKVSKAVQLSLKYHRTNSKKNTLVGYEFVLSRFQAQFSSTDIASITQDDIITFLAPITEGYRQNTRRNRFTTLSAFFNFIIDTFELHPPPAMHRCSGRCTSVSL